MKGGFTSGLIAGTIIGAAMVALINPEMNTKGRKRIIRNGRNFMRNTGHLVGDVIDMFR